MPCLIEDLEARSGAFWQACSGTVYGEILGRSLVAECVDDVDRLAPTERRVEMIGALDVGWSKANVGWDPLGTRRYLRQVRVKVGAGPSVATPPVRVGGCGHTGCAAPGAVSG